jgi:hypothetical protein
MREHACAYARVHPPHTNTRKHTHAHTHTPIYKVAQ